MPGELALFKQIWAEREHVSYVSGRRIMYFDVSCFAHVLAKGKHPDARLDAENIVLLVPEEHFLYDQGTISQRERYAERYGAKWDKLADLKIKLFRKYYPELPEWTPKNK